MLKLRRPVDLMVFIATPPVAQFYLCQGCPHQGCPHQRCPRQGCRRVRVALGRVAPARVTLPSPGCPGRVPRLLTSLSQELCTFSATALRTSSSSRAGEASSSFSMKFCLVAELGFKCEGPCQSSLLINCQGFPLVVTPARAPPGLPPPRLTYIYIYICRERNLNKKVFLIQKNSPCPFQGCPCQGCPRSCPRQGPCASGWPGLPRLALAILPYE